MEDVIDELKVPSLLGYGVTDENRTLIIGAGPTGLGFQNA